MKKLLTILLLSPLAFVARGQARHGEDSIHWKHRILDSYTPLYNFWNAQWLRFKDDNTPAGRDSAKLYQKNAEFFRDPVRQHQEQEQRELHHYREFKSRKMPFSSGGAQEAMQDFDYALQPPTAKNITSVGCGEYFTSYVTDELKVYGTCWNGSKNVFTDYGLTGVVEDIGEQYSNIVRLSTGHVRVIRKDLSGGGPQVDAEATDTTGAAFTNVAHPYGFWQSNLALKTDGTLWYYGFGNTLAYGSLGLNSNAVINKWMQLGQPTGGRVITKVQVFDNASAGMAVIKVLCSDGSVWSYFYGSATPTMDIASGVIDIAGITRGTYIVITSTDIKAYGPFCSYVGVTDGTTTPTSILASFTAQGLTLPLKQAVSSWNTFHVIDSKDDMYGEGDNMQGEVGNGIQYGDWKNYAHSGFAPYQWDFSRGGIMTGVIHITGKWKNLCGGSNIAFFFFVQDLCSGQWYSWGRGKEYALGNGVRINNDDAYPDWGIVPAPTAVSPSTVIWSNPEVNVDPAVSQNPTANAGQELCVTTSSISLSAAYSFQEGLGATITSFAWSKLSGTGGTITSATSSSTTVTGLTTGQYKYVITVGSSLSLSGSDTVLVSVTLPPTGCTNCIPHPKGSIIIFIKR